MDPAIAARIEGLREIIEDEPDALGHYMLAQELSKVDEHTEAAEHFRAVLALDGDYTAAYRGLGRSLMALGDRAGAEATWVRGLESAEKMGDLQTAKEMEVFLKRLRKG